MTDANAAHGRLDPGLALDAARVAEAAAIASMRLIGLGDEKAADQAAVDAMRTALNRLEIDGRIVIGEGERDEAPMLYIGERVGTGRGPKIDIALDPLEGTTLTAKAMPNALAVIAFSREGGMLHAPDVYMDKIAVGPGYEPGLVDLDLSPGENVARLAAAKGCKPSEITVCVLDRPRHGELLASLRTAGARVRLISDGDVAGVINTADPDTGIDLYLGSGGAPEGVLACAALKCVGGQFQGRLLFRNEDERARARRLGLSQEDFNRKYQLNELVSGDAVFAATGVTDGALLKGVKVKGGMVHTHTLVLESATGAVQEIRLGDRLCRKLPLPASDMADGSGAIVPESYLGVSQSLTGRAWRQRPADLRLVEAHRRGLGLSEPLARALAGRLVAEVDGRDHLQPTLKALFPDPSAFTDMDLAAELLVDAVVNERRCVVFADYDVDGATSAALLVRWFRAVGRDLPIYVPDRMTEGYGPSAAAFRQLKAEGAELVVTVDCGAAAHDALSTAAEIGLPVVVIDHHLMRGEPPPAAALVNPNRPRVATQDRGCWPPRA